MTQYKTHCVLEVNSRNRTSGTIENFTMELVEQIRLRPRVRYYVRAEKIRLPQSFFQIDSNFNTFSWDEIGVATHSLSITLAEASYNANELADELEIQMEAESAINGDTNTYTVVYNSEDNTINISFDTTGEDGTSITIQSGTLNLSLGYLGDGTENIVLGSNLDAADGTETRRITHININSNLGITNYYTATDNPKVIAKVPIIGDRWSYEYQPNNLGYLVQLNNDNIANITLFLKDEYGRTPDMRGSNYSFELVIYRERNMAGKIIEGFARLLGRNETEVRRIKMGKPMKAV